MLSVPLALLVFRFCWCCRLCRFCWLRWCNRWLYRVYRWLNWRCWICWLFWCTWFCWYFNGRCRSIIRDNFLCKSRNFTSPNSSVALNKLAKRIFFIIISSILILICKFKIFFCRSFHYDQLFFVSSAVNVIFFVDCSAFH